MRTRLASIALVLSASIPACSTPPPSASWQRIVGGQASAADPAVALLFSSKHACTASVISPHILLTAAHCVDYTDSPIEAFHVYLGPDLLAEDTPKLYPVVDRTAGPYYVSGQTTTGYDVGVFVSQDVLPVAPLPLRPRPVTAAIVGQQARIVGFGQTSAGDTSSKGTKREVTLTATSFDGFAVQFDDSAHGVCAGDSGSPVFVSTDGQEEVAGVVARSDAGCALWSSAATFDDEVLAFIDSAIAAHDPAGDLGTSADASFRDDTGGCSAAGRGPDRAWSAGVAAILAALWLSRRRARRLQGKDSVESAILPSSVMSSEASYHVTLPD